VLQVAGVVAEPREHRHKRRQLRPAAERFRLDQSSRVPPIPGGRDRPSSSAERAPRDAVHRVRLRDFDGPVRIPYWLLAVHQGRPIDSQKPGHLELDRAGDQGCCFGPADRESGSAATRPVSATKGKRGVGPRRLRFPRGTRSGIDGVELAVVSKEQDLSST
jgi:hypothetical protein